jgi:hypothetical protein
MRHGYAIWPIVLGVIVVVFGIVAEKFYYATGLYHHSDRRAPTWFGRGLFLIVGALFILAGILRLLS